MMQARLNPMQAAPEIIQAVLTLSAAVKNSGLEPSLQELVKIRASQINRCAFCLDMHTREARAQGESEERLYLLDAWRESPLYSPRERAALGWVEALTLLEETGAPDAVYDAARKEFSEAELVKLTVLITVINTWNRISVGFRAVHPMKQAKAA
jgi:AhpD family alkylhydroperoxidase